MQIKDEDCAACHDECNLMHIDGDFKLHNFKHNYEADRSVYHSGMVFAPDAELKRHEITVDHIVPTLGKV